MNKNNQTTEERMKACYQKAVAQITKNCNNFNKLPNKYKHDPRILIHAISQLNGVKYCGDEADSIFFGTSLELQSSFIHNRHQSHSRSLQLWIENIINRYKPDLTGIDSDFGEEHYWHYYATNNERILVGHGISAYRKTLIKLRDKPRDTAIAANEF